MKHILNLLDKITKRIERRRIYNKTLDDLSKLSDDDLRDIGIHRGMIRSIAMEACSDAK
jgi:uncharacterized protein YjiS (DUF1127 family)